MSAVQGPMPCSDVSHSMTVASDTRASAAKCSCNIVTKITGAISSRRLLRYRLVDEPYLRLSVFIDKSYGHYSITALLPPIVICVPLGRFAASASSTELKSTLVLVGKTLDIPSDNTF